MIITLIKPKLLYPITFLMTFSLMSNDKYLLSNLKINTFYVTTKLVPLF